MENMIILICDDDSSKVSQLQTVLGDDFRYVVLPTISEFEAHISSNKDYHGVFLDLHFDSENRTLDLDYIIKIKSILNPYSKFIIYTAFTINHLDLIKDLSRIGIIDDWIDIEELRSMEKMPSTRLRILKYLSFADDIKNGLWLIHLSDLHFGKQFKIGTDDIGDSLIDLIVDQLKSNIADSASCKITKPSMIVTSGDLSHTAEDSQFKMYKYFHLKLIESLRKMGVEYPMSIIAPGNHDFSWRISMIEENNVIEQDTKIILKEEQTDSDYYKSLKWLPYIENINDLHNATIKSKDKYSWWIHDYTKRLGINIFVLNSAKIFTYKSNNKISINYPLIKELSDNATIIEKQLGILVIHHPVDKWGDDKLQTELLKYLFSRLNIRIIFSGHKHRGAILKHKVEGKDFILEIQTGSMASKESSLDTFQLPNYRIINLKRNITSCIWENIYSYTFSYQDGAYIIQPKDKGGSYFEDESICNY